MNKTLIEWVKNPDGTQGYTWNPITGCLNHTPEGLCKGGLFPCYAYRLANGRLRERYLANTNVAYCYYRGKELIGPKELLGKCDYSDPFFPRFWEERLDAPLRLKRPSGIFVCDMSDLFGIGIPENWTYEVMQIIKQAQFMGLQHRFYLLTKQPQNLPRWSPFPDNCWVGVTATDIFQFVDAWYELQKIEARVKCLSFEPLLHRIAMEQAMDEVSPIRGINQVIIGACTGTLNDLKPMLGDTKYLGLEEMPYGKKWTLQPKIEWVEEIVRAADKAGILVFLKDNLRPIITERQKPFWYVDHYESHLRQEMPE